MCQPVAERAFPRPCRCRLAVHGAHDLVDLLVDLPIKVLDLRLDVDHRRMSRLIAGRQLRLLLRQLGFLRPQIQDQRRVQHLDRGLDIARSKLVPQLPQARFLLRPVRRREDELGIELGELLRGHGLAPGLGEVVLRLEGLDRLVRRLHLPAQGGEVLIEPVIGPAHRIELGFELRLEVGIDIGVGQARGQFAILGFDADLDDVGAAVIRRFHVALKNAAGGQQRRLRRIGIGLRLLRDDAEKRLHTRDRPVQCLAE